jgi:hypothetical protein
MDPSHALRAEQGSRKAPEACAPYRCSSRNVAGAVPPPSPFCSEKTISCNCLRGRLGRSGQVLQCGPLSRTDGTGRLESLASWRLHECKRYPTIPSDAPPGAADPRRRRRQMTEIFAREGCHVRGLSVIRDEKLVGLVLRRDVVHAVPQGTRRPRGGGSLPQRPQGCGRAPVVRLTRSLALQSFTAAGGRGGNTR